MQLTTTGPAKAGKTSKINCLGASELSAISPKIFAQSLDDFCQNQRPLLASSILRSIVMDVESWKKQPMLATVVIPCYNEKNGIRETMKAFIRYFPLKKSTILRLSLSTMGHLMALTQYSIP